MENRHFYEDVTFYENNHTNVMTSRSSSPLRFIVTSIMLVLICFMLFHAASGSGTQLTFSGFLNYIQNMPSLKLDFGFFKDLTILDDWGVFNIFRNFLNSLVGIFGIGAYLVSGVLQIVAFVVYSVGFFFGV